ncbi:hypothetical protein V6N13_113713 [Hibiscus sabdariffa]
MGNPNENLGLPYATTTFHPSERPSDAMIDVNSLVPHERPVNNSEEQHIDTSMMEIGDLQPDSGMIKEANESSDGVQPSFRDILARHAKRHDQRPVVDEIDVEVLADDVQLDLDGESSKKGALDEQPKHSGESNKMVYGAITMEKDDTDVSRDNMGVTSNKALAVASKENIILGKSNLDKGNPSVVRVVENNVKSNLQTKNVRVLPPSITHGKVAGRKLSIGRGLSRGNTKPKKPTNNQSGKPALVELVESLSFELDKAHELASQRQTERREVTRTVEDNVQWRENSTFETKLGGGQQI